MPTVVIHPLRSGTVFSPPGWVHREPGLRGRLGAVGVGVSRDRLIPLPMGSFLLEHPDRGRMLVDATTGARLLDDGLRADFGVVNALAFRGLRVRREELLLPQLRARGVEPEDIGTVVMTHLHVDHTGALPELPRAEVVVAGAEWEQATHSRAWADGYAAGHLPPRDRVRTVFDGGAAPGTRHDLLGDGSVVLVSTPGHTRGHLSVEVTTESGPVLLAGDAVYTLATLDEGRRPFRASDPALLEQTIEVLQAWRTEHPGATLVPTHDAGTWDALPDRL